MQRKLFAAAALCAALCAPAGAVTLISSSTGGGNVVTDYSADGLISFDLDMASTALTSLSYQITAADLLSPLNFSAVVRNYTGEGLDHLLFNLDRSHFDSIGSVSRTFGGTASVSLTDAGHTARIAFSSPEYLDVAIGNPTGINGRTDWQISPVSLRAGDVLTFTTAVPEPGTYALMLAGLAAVGFVARRRQNKG